MSELAYEDIKVGDEASLTRTITEVHIVNYAGLTGDMNPVHVDAEHAAQSMFGERIAHGMLVAGLISVAPVMIGDTIKVVVIVTDKRDEKRIIKLRTTAYNQRGKMVIDGNAVV